MPETTPLIKAALNLRVGVGFDVYEEHKYHVYSFCESNSSTPYFSIKEIFEENP